MLKRFLSVVSYYLIFEIPFGDCKSSFFADIGKILDALTKVEYTSDYVTRQFKSEKKRKRNRNNLQ
jgi:hypothetical protein